MIGARRIRDLVSPEGTPIKAISLPGGETPNEAVVDLDDFSFLMKLGLSVARRIGSGYVVAPSSKSPSGYVSVARVLTDAGPGQIVRYLDGDRFNLRRSNLALEDGHGRRATRDLVTQA